MSAAAAFTGSQALSGGCSRATGLALLAAFSAAVVLGVAARLGSAPKRWSRLALGELHRALALFCVAFLGLHVVTAITDPYVTIGSRGWRRCCRSRPRTGRSRSAWAPWRWISAAPS